MKGMLLTKLQFRRWEALLGTKSIWRMQGIVRLYPINKNNNHGNIKY